MSCAWESQTYDWFWGEQSETSLLTNFFYNAKADELINIVLLSKVGSSNYHTNKWIINSTSFEFASLHVKGTFEYNVHKKLPKENTAFFNNLSSNYEWVLEQKTV